MKRSLGWLVALLALGTVPAQAGLLIVQTTGTITGITDPLGIFDSTVHVGGTFRNSFNFDTTFLPTASGLNGQTYTAPYGQTYGMQTSLGDETMQTGWQTFSNMTVRVPPGGPDSLSYSSQAELWQGRVWGVSSSRIDLVGSLSPFLASAAIPGPPEWNLNLWPSALLTLRVSDANLAEGQSGLESLVTGRIQTLSVYDADVAAVDLAPEPSSLTLTGLALLTALAYAGWRRHRQNSHYPLVT